jgi:hypothetical protein
MKRASILVGSLVMAFSAGAFAQSAGVAPSVQTEDLGNVTPSPNPNVAPVNPNTGVRSNIPADSGYVYPSSSTYPSNSGYATPQNGLPNAAGTGSTTGMAGSGPGVPANQNGMGTSK